MRALSLPRAVPLALLALGSVISRAATAQVGAREAPPINQWVVADDRFADLWFHCLAVIGDDGVGPLSLYDKTYAVRARDAGRRDGARSLGCRAPELRRRLERDSAFEVLHFIPLYFVGHEPREVLAALRGAPGPVADNLATTARLVAATLPSVSQRGSFVALLDATAVEWDVAFRGRSAPNDGGRDADRMRKLALSWNRDFVPGLAAYLDAAGISRGTILVSPALGAEGRLVRASGGNVIVAVGLNPSSPDDDAPLFAAVRELAFPLVHAAESPDAGARGRADRERASDVAATRAGAMLLDVVAPSFAVRYRNVLREAAAGVTSARSFDDLYSLGSAEEARLRAAVIVAAHAPTSPH